MSVNKYNTTTGELETIASGQRTWVGTRAAYDAAKSAGTLPTNALICITDDEDDTIADAVTDGDSRAVTSNAVYDAIAGKANVYKTEILNGQTLKVQFTRFEPYLISMCGLNGGVFAVWAGIGYGESSARHAITKIVDGSSSSVFTVTQGTDFGYGLTISTTYSQSSTQVRIISSGAITKIS